MNHCLALLFDELTVLIAEHRLHLSVVSWIKENFADIFISRFIASESEVRDFSSGSEGNDYQVWMSLSAGESNDSEILGESVVQATVMSDEPDPTDPDNVSVLPAIEGNINPRDAADSEGHELALEAKLRLILLQAPALKLLIVSEIYHNDNAEGLRGTLTMGIYMFEKDLLSEPGTLSKARYFQWTKFHLIYLKPIAYSFREILNGFSRFSIEDDSCSAAEFAESCVSRVSNIIELMDMLEKLLPYASGWSPYLMRDNDDVTRRVIKATQSKQTENDGEDGPEEEAEENSDDADIEPEKVSAKKGKKPLDSDPNVMSVKMLRPHWRCLEMDVFDLLMFMCRGRSESSQSDSQESPKKEKTTPSPQESNDGDESYEEPKGTAHVKAESSAEFGPAMTCIDVVIKIWTLLFSWGEFTSNRAIIAGTLEGLVPGYAKKSQINGKTPISPLLIKANDALSVFTETLPSLMTTIQYLKMLQALAMVGSDSKVTERLHADIGQIAALLLQREWDEKEKKPDSITYLVELEIKHSTNRFKLVSDYVRKAFRGLLEKDAESCCDFPMLDMTNMWIFYKLCLLELASLIDEERPGIGDLEGLDRVREITVIYSQAIEYVKRVPDEKFLLVVLRHSRQFLTNFIKRIIPALNASLQSAQEVVLSILGSLQTATRILQTLCNESKASRSANRLTYVPPLRKLLESLVFEVKNILEENNCLKAFYVGNLKHRNLKGDAISSQLPASDIEDSDEDAKEGAEDDDGKPFKKRKKAKAAGSGSDVSNDEGTGKRKKKKPAPKKKKQKDEDDDEDAEPESDASLEKKKKKQTTAKKGQTVKKGTGAGSEKQTPKPVTKKTADGPSSRASPAATSSHASRSGSAGGSGSGSKLKASSNESSANSTPSKISQGKKSAKAQDDEEPDTFGGTRENNIEEEEEEDEEERLIKKPRKGNPTMETDGEMAPVKAAAAPARPAAVAASVPVRPAVVPAVASGSRPLQPPARRESAPVLSTLLSNTPLPARPGGIPRTQSGKTLGVRRTNTNSQMPLKPYVRPSTTSTQVEKPIKPISSTYINDDDEE
ncbi:Fanconi anemia group D2 protein [Blyttiomyces sp. JEL0837]|nr:Fanconi anemia group D2 protein [Blyttiomyces sp. JEL0837]